MSIKRITLKETIKITGIPLKIVSKLSDGSWLRKSEKQKESSEHRWLVLRSARYFRQRGYRVKRSCVSVEELYVASDYFMLTPDNQFFFVEALSKNNIAAIKKKKKLEKYAPVYFVAQAGTLVARALKNELYVLLMLPETLPKRARFAKNLEEKQKALKLMKA